MKYIITENRLDKVIFKFLDTEYGALEQKKGKHVDIVLNFPGEEFGVLGRARWGDLYVSYTLRNEVSKYFGLGNVDTLNVIGKWVEDRYNLKVIDTIMKTGDIFFS